MDARIQTLPFDPAALSGLPSKRLTSHHQNNYGGAVKRHNAIRAVLAERTFATAPGFQLNRLKREELIATNSIVLHQLYFAGLGGDGATMDPPMKLALEANFGSDERWRDEFTAMGRALGGGSGWVLLTFQPREGTLLNHWCADHTHGLAGGVPILALYRYEHAYPMDYGAASSAYVDALMRARSQSLHSLASARGRTERALPARRHRRLRSGRTPRSSQARPWGRNVKRLPKLPARLAPIVMPILLVAIPVTLLVLPVVRRLTSALIDTA